ncbi:MAG: hypothetical protein IK095_03015 [Oscillospiraceae bacterium]|nr:hypothetical protein [Oscillospiraceae bacterium]
MTMITALLLALFLIAGSSITAAATRAKTGTTTITFEVTEGSFTIHIPHDVRIKYGDTDIQIIGCAYVSDVTGINKEIVCHYSGSSLKCGDYEIPVTWYDQSGPLIDDESGTAAFEKRETDGDHSGSFCVYEPDGSPDTPYKYMRFGMKIERSAWAHAVRGDYTATLDFTFSVDEDQQRRCRSEVSARIG